LATFLYFVPWLAKGSRHWLNRVVGSKFFDRIGIDCIFVQLANRNFMACLYSCGISENSLPRPLILLVNKQFIHEVPIGEPRLHMRVKIVFALLSSFLFFNQFRWVEMSFRAKSF
jgi:hypothetical protein